MYRSINAIIAEVNSFLYNGEIEKTSLVDRAVSETMPRVQDMLKQLYPKAIFQVGVGGCADEDGGNVRMELNIHPVNDYALYAMPDLRRRYKLDDWDPRSDYERGYDAGLAAAQEAK